MVRNHEKIEVVWRRKLFIWMLVYVSQGTEPELLGPALYQPAALLLQRCDGRRDRERMGRAGGG